MSANDETKKNKQVQNNVEMIKIQGGSTKQVMMPYSNGQNTKWHQCDCPMTWKRTRFFVYQSRHSLSERVVEALAPRFLTSPIELTDFADLKQRYCSF